MDEDEQFQLAFGEQTQIRNSTTLERYIHEIKNNGPNRNEFNLQYHYIPWFSDLALELIGRYIARNTHLRTINLNFLVDRKASTISKLFQGLSQGHVLEELFLEDNDMGTDDIRNIVPLLRNSPKLSHLHLSGNRLNTEGFEVLMNALDGGPIEVLYLNSCSTTGGGGIENISALGNYATLHLRELHLAGNNIHNLGNISTLQNHTNLVSLDLGGNNVGIDGCRTIANLLLNEDSRLESLQLDGNNIGDEGAEILATSLKQNSALKAIYLRRNNLTERGFRAFLQLMNDISSIKSTYTSNHTLEDIRLSLESSTVRRKREFDSTMNEMDSCIQDAVGFCGREKIIDTQLDSKKQQQLCRLQGVTCPYSSIFAQIDPLVLPEVLALIGNRYYWRISSDLYCALVATAPELTSLVNKPVALKEKIAKKQAQIDALTAEYRREMNTLTAEMSKMNEELQSLVPPDESVSTNVSGTKRQRSS